MLSIMDEDLEHFPANAVCVSSLFNPPKDLVLINRDNFSLGESLACYDFLFDIICAYLDRHDLQSIKQVNSKWNELADIELNKRLNPSWIFCDSERVLLQSTSKFFYNNASIGIVLFNKKFIRLNSYVCLHRGPNLVRMSFAEYTSKEIMHGIDNYFAIACVPMYAMRPLESFAQHDISYKSMFQCLLLPPIPNMRVYLRHLSEIANLKSEEVDDEILRCIIVFTQQINQITIRTFFQTLQEANGSHGFVFGGGVVHSTKCFLSNHTTKYFLSEDLYCILFSQRKNEEADFDAYSEIMVCDTFESQLDQFRTEIVCRKYGVVYAFFPAKVKNNGNRTILLREYFPGYQFACLKVPMQIGIGSEDRKVDFQEISLTHTSTITLVVVTWGTKI